MEKFLQQVEQTEITHEDYTNALTDHPKMPLYLSGNCRGIVSLWSLNQQADRCLDAWLLEPEVPPHSANPRKATVKQIEFNSFGDRFTTLNLEGSLFVHNFESNSLPLFKFKGQKLSHFCHLDPEGTVVAAVSYSNKTLCIIDTMLPLNHCVLASLKGTAATLVLSDPYRQRLYAFNAKPGVVTEYDLKKTCTQVQQKQLLKDEITSVLLVGHKGALVAVGSTDGHIRIYDSSTWDLRETLSPFVSVQGKKGSVLAMKSHRESGALFASSSAGCVKLVRFGF